MKIEIWQIWVGVAALIQTALLMWFGYLRKKPLVSAATADELRKALIECRAACVEARSEAADLRAQLGIMRAELSRLLTQIDSLKVDLEWYKDKWIQSQRRIGPGSAS